MGAVTMSRIKWYKMDADAWYAGTRCLSPEERGIYMDIITRIIASAGRAYDDNREMARWCGVDLRVWMRVKKRLIELGKIFVEDGLIRNSRADREVHDALGRLEVGAQLNAIKGRKSGQVRKKNNDLGEPSEPRNIQLTTKNIKDSYPPIIPPFQESDTEMALQPVEVIPPDGGPLAPDEASLFQPSMLDDELPPASKPKQPQVADEEFERWWSVCEPGRKASKEKCRQKFNAAVKKKGCAVDTIITSWLNYLEYCRETNTFTKLPLTWLNDEGWNYELSVEAHQKYNGHKVNGSSALVTKWVRDGTLAADAAFLDAFEAERRSGIRCSTTDRIRGGS